MRAQPADTISMAYVDIIMNSMGCLLVLFLLMTVIRGNVNLGAAAAEEGTVAPPDPNVIEGGTDRAALRDPFVILVTSGRPGPMFAENPGEVWSVPDEYRAVSTRHSGPSFATLYAPARPTGPIRLQRVRGISTVTVRVSQGGRELRPRTVEVRDGTAEVWPAPAEANP
jgi:hypothetical protein